MKGSEIISQNTECPTSLEGITMHSENGQSMFKSKLLLHMWGYLHKELMLFPQSDKNVYVAVNGEYIKPLLIFSLPSTMQLNFILDVTEITFS
jgi:hypothetical protein